VSTSITVFHPWLLIRREGMVQSALSKPDIGVRRTQARADDGQEPHAQPRNGV
jgi:hypothetical protein